MRLFPGDPDRGVRIVLLLVAAGLAVALYRSDLALQAERDQRWLACEALEEMEVVGPARDYACARRITPE